MAEGKRKARKVTGETPALITVDAGKRSGALKHTFEGVTMLFDCLGLDVAVTELSAAREKEPGETCQTVSGELAPEAKEQQKAADHPEERGHVGDGMEEVKHETVPAVTATETVKESASDNATGSATETVTETGTQPAAVPVALTATVSVTQDDITRIIVRKIKTDRSNNEKIGAIMKTYGVAKVSDLPASKYEAFLTDLSQI